MEIYLKLLNLHLFYYKTCLVSCSLQVLISLRRLCARSIVLDDKSGLWSKPFIKFIHTKIDFKLKAHNKYLQNKNLVCSKVSSNINY